MLEKQGMGILNVECVVTPSISKVVAIPVIAESEYFKFEIQNIYLHVMHVMLLCCLSFSTLQSQIVLHDVVPFDVVGVGFHHQPVSLLHIASTCGYHDSFLFSDTPRYLPVSTVSSL